MRYSEGICSINFNNQTRSQSHTERFKKTTICFNRKKATWSLRKKKENEKEIQANLTESLHLTVETQISENIRQTVNAETTKRLLMKNLPWHAIRWLSNQTTVTPLKFLIIIHNYANVWTINHSKSLPGFRVVTSLDGIIQTFNRAEKTTGSNRLKSRLLFGEFRFSKKSFNVLISSFTIFNGFVATLALRRTDVCHGNFVISLVKL